MRKRIAIATLGTQGDVQPYVALALELQRRGHEVVFGTSSDFGDFVKRYGIEFFDLGIEIQSFIAQGGVDRIVNRGDVLHVPEIFAQGQRMFGLAARRGWEMAQGADALLLSMNTTFAIDIAEALNVPAIMAAPQPLNTTAEFPLVAYSGPQLGPTFNRISYSLMGVLQAYYNLQRRRLRRDVLGLNRLAYGKFLHDNQGRPLTTLYCYSSIVAPRPSDWPETSLVTGYWRLADRTGWTPSPEFRAFLAAGEAPVYIGFGSMPYGAERNTEILKQGVALWGGRAVVARGWGGFNADNLPPNIFAIEAAPHDKLFQHVKAVVHHGGAGTTAAGLFAGKPTFIVPQTVDQPFWGKRVRELGAGPEPVRLKKLTPGALAAALRELTSNDDFERSARSVAKKLATENGPSVASDAVEGVVDSFMPRARLALA